MPNLLSSLNNTNFNNDKSKMYKLLAILFVVFLVIGLLFGFFANKFLSKDQVTEGPKTETEENVDSYEGTVTYIDSFLYPEDNISFVLVDAKGNDIILLKAKDQKLEVAEGHFVTAFGVEMKTANGKEKYLLVEKVVLNNATD